MPLDAPLRPLPSSLEAAATALRALMRERAAWVLLEEVREATR